MTPRALALNREAESQGRFSLMSNGIFGLFKSRAPSPAAHAAAPAVAPPPAAPRDYRYFDEDYFQNGESKGTAYRDYQSSSRSSPLYAEIAGACASLKPRRALEIGCATGVIVARLNDMGVETHGIDVSSWAVEHREHPQVVLAGAESLPFPDGWFDLVYSVHALEHLPAAVADAAFAEIARVSAPDAVQFHTLPILGLGPYAGERGSTVAGLKKDPTHHLLEDEPWWQERFAAAGFVDLGVHFLFEHEQHPDLSLSQLLLLRPGAEAERLRQVRAWNGSVIRRYAEAARAARAGIRRLIVETTSPWLALPGTWADVEAEADFLLDDQIVFTATIALKADAPTTLRFCFLSGEGDEADHIRTYAPGVTTFQFRRRDLLQRLGSAGRVRKVVFGGEGRGAVQAGLVAEKAGVAAFSM